MFFILGKIVIIFLSPQIWIFTFLLLAWLKKSRRFLLAAILSTFFFGNCFIADEVCRAWEIQINEEQLTTNYDYGIVLGGMSDYQARNKRSQFSGASDRLWQSLLLQSRGKIDTLIITGGSGKWDNPEEKEALLLQQYLNEVVTANDSILYEWESKNTAENAQFTLTKYPQIRDKKILVITSGFHARRALACFNKIGLKTDIYTVDMMGGDRKYALDHLLLPNPSAMRKWSFIMKEWLGCLVYQLRGWI
tara:strand:+ start:29951 stop:30697 length:747 start_codon:yes stop_codon:yes gene_type:complete